MTLREFILFLIDSGADMDYEVYASSPSNEDDFYVDSIAVNDMQKQLFIKTAQ